MAGSLELGRSFEADGQAMYAIIRGIQTQLERSIRPAYVHQFGLLSKLPERADREIERFAAHIEPVKTEMKCLSGRDHSSIQMAGAENEWAGLVGQSAGTGCG